MLSVVKIVNATRTWYEAKPGIISYDECCPTMSIHPPGV